MDAHKNFAVGVVAVAPSPATSGTSLTLQAGMGSRFPAAPFNASVGPQAVSVLGFAEAAEIVRVTARASDVLTIERKQEGTLARTIVAGDVVANALTAKALTDIEAVAAESPINESRLPSLVVSGSALGTTSAQKAANASDLTSAGEARQNLHVPELLPVQAVAVLNVASLAGLPTVDGLTLEAEQTVLLANQTEAKNNGPWVVAAGEWARPADFATGANVKARKATVVGGNVFAGSEWLLKTSATITVGTTAQPWAQIAWPKYIPGVVAGNSSVDYGAIINTYMAGLATAGLLGDTPSVLPPGKVFISSEVIPPTGIVLVGSGWSQDVNNIDGTTLLPRKPSLTRVASISNTTSGFSNLNINGNAPSDPNIVKISFGVYAGFGTLRGFGCFGGSEIVFDSNSSGHDLTMNMFQIESQAPAGGTAVDTSISLNAAGPDWVVSAGRVTNGSKRLNSGGGLFSGVHFTYAAGGGEPGSNANVIDYGAQTLTACYFDSVPNGSSNALIDRSQATKPSVYAGCQFFQVTAPPAGIPWILESTHAGAGIIVTGARVQANSGDGLSYFIKGAIASTVVVGVACAAGSVGALTDTVPPLGLFTGCVVGSAPAALGGTLPGGNQSSVPNSGVLLSNVKTYTAVGEEKSENRKIVAEGFSRDRLGGTLARPTSGQPVARGIWTPPFTAINGVAFYVGAREGTPTARTHLWIAILNAAGEVVARGLDYTSNTNTPLVEGTFNALMLAAPYTSGPSAELLYAVLCEVVSASTCINIGLYEGLPGVMTAAPMLCATLPEGQTTPEALAAKPTMTTSAKSYYLALV